MLFKSVIVRFIKGTLGGMATALSLVSYQTPAVWSDFHSVLNVLGVAAVSGAISGFLLAFMKWASWKN